MTWLFFAAAFAWALLRVLRLPPERVAVLREDVLFFGPDEDRPAEEEADLPVPFDEDDFLFVTELAKIQPPLYYMHS